MISSVTAWEWDNRGNYNQGTRTMEVRNSLGFGSVVSEIKLNTPLDYKVAPGYTKVAEFDVINNEDYNEALRGIEFYDRKDSMKKIERDFDYKVKTIERVRVDDYRRVCNNIFSQVNQTMGVVCSDIKNGGHFENKTVWRDLDKSVLRQGEFTIGIFTDVKVNDKVEWIPTFFGIEINEWAIWTASLNVNISVFWDFDQGTGNELPDVTGLNPNATLVNMENSDWIAGVIGNALITDGVNEFINTTFAPLYTITDNYSISLWLSTSNVAGTGIAFGGSCPNADEIVLQNNAAGGASWRFRTVDGSTTNNYDITATLSTGSFRNVVVVSDKGTDALRIYVDGVSTDNYTDGQLATINMSSCPWFIGASDNSGSASSHLDGSYDLFGVWDRVLTQGEVTQLYNGGVGITFGTTAITLNSPVNNFNSSTPSIEFNCSVTTVGGVQINNLSLILDGVINETVTFGIPVNSSTQIFTKNISEGSHTWNCQTVDTINETVTGNTRNFDIDTISPIIDVETPSGILNFNIVNGNQTLNVTFIDTNLDMCWFDYNGTNITIDGCVSNIKNSTTFALEPNNFNMTLYANDTSGNENSSFVSWSYKILLNSQTFNPNTTEGNTESFEANITLLEGFSVNVALLVYNGTANVGSATVSGSNTILSINDVIIPAVEFNANLSFFWAILLSDSTTVNFTTQNQTVFALGIDNCSSFTNVILNLTNVDEKFQTILVNSTIETAINIFASDATTLVLNISGTFSTNPTAICLNNPLTNESNYLMNVIVKYTAEGHAIEYFNLVNFVLNLQTSNQNITLFDLNLSDSTEFQLTFTGSDFLPEENVLVFVERQYIAENVFKTVELPLTDSNGQTVLHLVRNDIIYNLRFIKDGITLGIFENIIAFCEDFSIGDCRLDLSAISNASAFEKYDKFVGISYTTPPTFDSNTNLVSFSFVSEDGTTKSVVMNVERRDIFGNQTVCTNTVVSTSGTLFCNIGANLTETTLFTVILVGTNELIFNTVVITDSSFGDIGYALWFILTLLLIIMASDSKNGIIMVTLFSYLGALSMGWFVGGAVGVGSSGVWVLIISAAALWRINRRRN